MNKAETFGVKTNLGWLVAYPIYDSIAFKIWRPLRIQLWNEINEHILDNLKIKKDFSQEDVHFNIL